MGKFEVGQRVAVYGPVMKGDGKWAGTFWNGTPAEVVSVDTKCYDAVCVELLADHLNCEKVIVSTKQCRRLKPRKRRSVWVRLDLAERCASGSILEARDYNPNSDSFVEFREVVRRGRG